jgi:uncharacterized protein
MKLHSESFAGLNTVTGYGLGFVEVNQARYTTPILILPEGAVQPWEIPGFAQLSFEHFLPLQHYRPEIVLLGSGARQQFPHPRLMAALAQAGMGLETMDTPAACRTYNILVAEGRKVAAALIL